MIYKVIFFFVDNSNSRPYLLDKTMFDILEDWWFRARLLARIACKFWNGEEWAEGFIYIKHEQIRCFEVLVLEEEPAP